MATIQERMGKSGKPRYRVQVRLKGQPVQYATFERKTDARKWAGQTEAAIREGRYFPAAESKRRTFAELADRYIEEVLPKKPRSIDIQKRQMLWWRNQLGEYPLAAITPAVLSECRNKLATEKSARYGKRSPATQNRYFAVLSHAFSVAVREWGWLDTNPVCRIKREKEPRGRVRFLDDNERERLLSACRESTNPFLYPVVVLALSTGMRRGEIMSLRWADVDVHRGVITIHDTKNQERRAVPLVGHALAVVKEFSRIRRLDTDLLFPSKENPAQPMDLRTPWVSARSAAGIENFRFHDLRHTAASYLLASGATLGQLAEILGHKTLQMVKRYSHLSQSSAHEIVAKMADGIFPSETAQSQGERT